MIPTAANSSGSRWNWHGPLPVLKTNPAGNWDADDLTDSPTAYFLVRLRVLNCWGVRYPIDECFRSNR
jgi:hypothetical protein